MTELAIGKPAPDFERPATGNKTIKLSELRGKWVVLYFYPRDNTPGCTQEGENFNDLHPQFRKLGAVILGVSRDTIGSHRGFHSRMSFTFDLLSDEDETVCKLFDVMKLKTQYGQQAIGVERSTFLIDPEGVLRREWRKVKVEGHAREVLAALKELSPPAA
ncbi:MAG: peroxiredoxin [Gammaproteobacteria bacterium]